MSTRSLIGLKDTDGSVGIIYCHWDGYPSNNGKILLESYRDVKKVRQLIGLGDISSLGEEIGRKHPFDWMIKASRVSNEHYVNALKNGPYAKMCNVFGRDRGDKDTEARRYASVEALEEAIRSSYGFFEEYLYIFDASTGTWHWLDTHGSVQSLDGLAELTADVCKEKAA